MLPHIRRTVLLVVIAAGLLLIAGHVAANAKPVPLGKLTAKQYTARWQATLNNIQKNAGHPTSLFEHSQCILGNNASALCYSELYVKGARVTCILAQATIKTPIAAWKEIACKGQPGPVA